MKSVLIASVVAVFTVCSEMSATELSNEEVSKIWSNGKIIVSAPRSQSNGVYAVIKYKQKIYHCNSIDYGTGMYFLSRCKTFD